MRRGAAGRMRDTRNRGEYHRRTIDIRNSHIEGSHLRHLVIRDSTIGRHICSTILEYLLLAGEVRNSREPHPLELGAGDKKEVGLPLSKGVTFKKTEMPNAKHRRLVYGPLLPPRHITLQTKISVANHPASTRAARGEVTGHTSIVMTRIVKQKRGGGGGKEEKWKRAGP